METLQLNHRFYCGIDLHAKNMYVCVMNKKGDILEHRTMENKMDNLLHTLKRYRKDVAVGVESTYNWYWLADACQRENIPFYLGHAMYMKAIHGAKKKNDSLDAKMITNLLRTNLFPPAYVYPQEMRATRDLLRRRHYYVRLRAGNYTHIQGVLSQQGIIDIPGEPFKTKSGRTSIVSAMTHQLSHDPDTCESINADMEMVYSLDAIIKKLTKRILTQAKHYDPHSLSLILTIPGMGDILALTVLYEIHTIERFASPQKFSSYCRVVKPERISSGKNTGGGNKKIGNPYLKWAFTELVSHAAAGSSRLKKHYEKYKVNHSQGKARMIMAHKFAVALYYMLKNKQVFDEKKFVGEE